MIVGFLRRSTAWLRRVIERGGLVVCAVLGLFAILLLLSFITVGAQRFNLVAETEFVLFRVGSGPHATEDLRIGALRLDRPRSVERRLTGERLEVDGVTLAVQPGGRLTLHAIRLEQGSTFGVLVGADGWVHLDMSDVAEAPILLTVEPPATMTSGSTAAAIERVEALEILPDRDFRLAFSMADDRPLRLGQAVPVVGLSFDDDRAPTTSFSRLRNGALQFDLWGGRPDRVHDLRDGETVALAGLAAHLRHLFVVAHEQHPVAARALQLQAVGRVNGATAGFLDRRDRELRPNLLENLVSIEFLRIFGGIVLALISSLIGFLKLRDSADGATGIAGKPEDERGGDAAPRDRDARAITAKALRAPPVDGVEGR